MWEVDLDQFWKDDEIAHRSNCFYRGEQVAFGIWMSDECVFAELGEEGTPWAPIPRKRRLELNKRYNDKAERIVGKRLLREQLPEPRSEFPYVKRIGEVFGGSYVYENDTEWLTQSVETPEELEKLLDRVEKWICAISCCPRTGTVRSAGFMRNSGKGRVRCIMFAAR